MVALASRMVVKDRMRFGITAAGVGCTIVLILFLFGIYEGVRREANGYVSQRSADLWLSQNNSTNLIRSTSLLNGAIGAEIEGVDGIASLTPLLRTIGSADIDGEQVTLFILGIDPASAVSRPMVTAGSAGLDSGQIVLDRAFAAKYRLGIGDPVHIQDHTFRVAGLSTGTNAVITQFSFVTLQDAERLLGMPEAVSFWLARVDSGISPHRLAHTLRERFPALNVFTHEEFVANNLEEMQTGVLPILWTVASLGALVGGAVLTLLLYGAVLEKRADYALLKAIGAGQRLIVLLVVRQSLLAVAAGLVLGSLLYAAGAPLLREAVPEIALSLTWRAAAGVVGTAFLIGAVGACLPIYKLGRIYPAEVFRA